VVPDSAGLALAHFVHTYPPSAGASFACLAHTGVPQRRQSATGALDT
jgi:hypothetical protein